MGSTINAKSVDDTMYHPNSATTDCIVDILHKGEGGPFNSVFTAPSPSSECPSLREGPPQKGKIGENSGLPGALEWRSETTCLNCRKSHREGLRLVCDRWGIQNILMPQRTCDAWKFDQDTSKAARDAGSPLSTTVDNALSAPGRIGYEEDSGLQYVENPPSLFIRDPNGYWEPVKPRSCTNCKLYNDPICMKIDTHIGNRAQIWQREDLSGFQCIAVLHKEEREAVITSIGCNNRKAIR